MGKIVKILIVDDDQVDQMAIQRALKAAEIDGELQIEIASYAAKALEMAGKEKFDIIFLDYLLPAGETGADLLKQLRQSGNRSPVVMVTSEGDQKIAVEVMKSGAYDYITKNEISPAQISRIVSMVMRAYRTELEKEEVLQTLKKNEALLAEAQRIAKIGSWEFDLSTHRYSWSLEIYRIMGFDKDTFEPRFEDYLQHLHPDYKKMMREEMEKVLVNPASFSFDVKFIDSKGELIDVSLMGRPEADENGRIVKMIGTLQDITERKRGEKEIIEAKNAAEQSARARQEFLANVSHEIRTPMNAIIGFTKLLLEGDLNEEQLEYLKTIDTAGETLLGILNDILDFSKMESGGFALEFRPTALRQTLPSMLDIFKLKAMEKGLDLDLKISPDVPDLLVADGFRLNQVLLNLLGNAIKFSERGSIELRVTPTEVPENEHLVSEAGKAKNWYKFEVEDQGIGIDSDKLSLIFEPFSQAEKFISRKYGGTGLGLTISRRLVELMGGKLGVTSAAGKGSIFYFILPLETEFNAAAIQVQVDKDNFSGFTPGNYKLLVAEDNPINQKLISTVLEKAGFNFAVAGSGEAALEMVQNENFDLILMDIQLPGMDGLEATRKIRSGFSLRANEIPIIALTAQGMNEDREIALRYGMNDFISKPFIPSVLIQKITHLLGIVSPSKEDQNHPAYSVLEEVCGSDLEFKRELVEVFLRETPALLRAMLQSFKEGNRDELFRVVHTMKPSFALFDLVKMKQMADEMELLIKGKNNEPALGLLISTMEKEGWLSIEEVKKIFGKNIL